MHWILINLVIMLAYVAVGHASQLLGVPPVNIAPIWPPAGIALAALLLYGARVIPGIFLGSLMLHLSALLDAGSTTPGIALAVGVLTSLGAALQALLGYRLIGAGDARMPPPLSDERQVLRFVLFGGLLACSVAPTLGLLGLMLTGTLQLADAPMVWGTWWVGGTLGVIIVTPVLLTLFAPRGRNRRRRMFALVLPLLLSLALVMVYFRYLTHQVHDRIQAQFQQVADTASSNFLMQLREVDDYLQLTGKFLQTPSAVGAEDLRHFASIFRHLPGVNGVYWFEHAAAASPRFSAQLQHNDCAGLVPPAAPDSGADRFLVVRNGSCRNLYLYQLLNRPAHAPGQGRGSVVIAVDLQRAIDSGLRPFLPEGSSLKLQLLGQDGSTRALIADAVQPEVYQIEADFRPVFRLLGSFGPARVQLQISADANYVVRQYGWEAWTILFGGLLFSSLLGVGLLIMTGRHESTKRLVHERTAALAAEVEERRNAEQLLELQNTILEHVARDQPLQRILDHICLRFEALSRPDTHASVMLVDDKQQCLRIGAAPTLPSEVFEALNALPIDDNEGSCGSAAYRGELVVCDDIATSPEWGKYRHLAMAQGLHASWSLPFYSSAGTILGTFALTQGKPRSPQEQDLLHLRSAASLCALTVEQAQHKAHINQLSLALEQSPSAVVMIDLAGRIEYANPRFAELTGYQREEAYGRTFGELLQTDLETQALERIWQEPAEGREWHGTLRSYRKDGSAYWAQYKATPMRDSAGQITHVLAIHDDVSELRSSNEKIVYQATHDLLTGLINRAEFEASLTRLLESARRYKEHHALCFIDLDQFKIINDSSGHAAGDELLRQLSSLMRQHIRKNDILARIGGDEFAILFEHCDLQTAVANVEKLRRLVAEHPFAWDQRNYSVGMSAGVVAIDALSPNAVELLREADAACYTAKETGRNRVQVYSPDDETTARRSNEIRWTTRLREALQEERLELFQQRIRTLLPRDGLDSMEILLRQRTRNGELVSPGAFLPAAERFGLAQQIDTWVTRNTFARLAGQSGLLEQLNYCSINLSALSLNLDFADQILRWLDRYALPAQKICFEITETAAIANLSQATQFIQRLRGRGIRFALDDFGSGLSSFAYLKNLPVDILKIDGQFVRDILNDPIDMAMVRAINEIGKVMGKQTVAEFVEHPYTLELLREMGVNSAQGYAISKPAPLAEAFAATPGDHDLPRQRLAN